MVFYEADSSWEGVDLPDVTVVYRVGGSHNAGSHDPRVRVSSDMLPGEGELIE